VTPPSPTVQRLALAMRIEAVLLVAYWTLWAIDHSLVAADDSPEYDAFEAAFPLPDGFIALCLLLAAGDLVRGRRRGVFFTIAAAGAGMFLALTDLAYDLQNGIFTKGVNGALEAVIVVVIFTSSIVFGRWAFRTLAADADAAGAEW